MKQWAGKNPIIVLAVLILLAFFVADGWHIINFPPTSIHQWRQSDCVAYARNYYTKNSSFLKPSFYNLVPYDGRSISEFPVFYYLAARLYHVFGFHYWVLRGLTFLSFFAGLYWLYKCIRFWIQDSLAALFPVILLATTPFYYYYALNVLPNVPAISLSFGGLYYMLLYERAFLRKYLIVSTVLFILSVLLKPTDGGLIWMAYLCVTGKKLLFDKDRDQKIIPVLVSAAIVVCSLYGWYKYANWYNLVNHNDLNLLGIYPIWDMTRVDVKYTLAYRIMGFWEDSYQHRIILYFLGGLLIAYIVKWRALHPFLKFFTLFLLLGSLSYSVLWFKAFDVLDYYQLINVIAPVFVIITLLEYYCNKIAVTVNRGWRYTVSIVLVMFAGVSILHNKDVQHLRYTTPELTYKPRYFYQIEPYLRSIGITPRDTVISIPDITPNITLSAIGNAGYTSFYNFDAVTIQKHKENGSKYLIVSDTAYLHNKLYLPFMTKKIGQFHDIYIYDLRPIDFTY